MLIPAIVLGALFLAGAAVADDLRWVAGLSLLPLLVAIRKLSRWQAMFCGAVWGAALCGFLLYSAPVAPSNAVLLTLLTATITAVYAFAGSLVTRWIGFSPLVMATGWIGVELALQPMAFRYGLLSSAVGEGQTMQVVGGLLGYVFIAFLVAYSNAWLLHFAGNIRLRIPRPQLRLSVAGLRGLSVPQIAFASPLPVIGRSHPRAPPA